MWGGAADCHACRVQKVIHFAARLVTGTRRYDHISPTLTALGWPSLAEMVRRRDCINVYRALHESEAPSALRSQFRSRDEISLRHTRASASGLSSLHLSRVRLTATQHQFNYRATKSWNELPPEAANALSRRSFMTILKS